MVTALKRQLAVDLNCSAGDFDRNKNTVTILQRHDTKRRMIADDLLLYMACFGKGTVAAVNAELEPSIRCYLADMEGFRCFDMPLDALAARLKTFGGYISEIEEFYLLETPAIQPVKVDFDMEILEGAEIKKLYSDERFHMALGYSQMDQRRDVLAVAAYKGGEILGVAGASNDTDDIWQIGIDVVPGGREQHVATGIVKSISNEILKRKKIPYYGTAWSNIASKRVAINAGYKPVWVEMKAKRRAEQ